MFFYLKILLLYVFSISFAYAQIPHYDINFSSENEVEQILTDLNKRFLKNRDKRIYFNGIYLIVTQGLKKERRNPRYRYPECIEAMIVEFSRMYFKALNDHYQGKAPLPWSESFNLNAKPTTHLLLGMNAHISYDLPISLLKVSQKMKDCSPENIQEDYFALNDFFEKTTPLLDRELKRLHASMSFSKKLDLDNLKETIVTELVFYLREDAWFSFLELHENQSPALNNKRKNLEASSYTKALFFKSLNILLPRAGL